MIWWPTLTPTLSHGLITLRPLVESDITNIYSSCQDPLIPRFTRVPRDYTMAHAEFFVREKMPHSFAEKTELAFAIDYGNGGDEVFAGVISFHSVNLPDHVAELGYWINASMRGKGVGATAAHLVPRILSRNQARLLLHQVKEFLDFRARLLQSPGVAVARQRV